MHLITGMDDSGDAENQGAAVLQIVRLAGIFMDQLGTRTIFPKKTASRYGNLESVRLIGIKIIYDPNIGSGNRNIE